MFQLLILDTFLSICDFLNLPMAYILTGSASSSVNYIRNEISDLIYKYSPSKITLVAKFIKEVSEFKE